MGDWVPGLVEEKEGEGVWEGEREGEDDEEGEREGNRSVLVVV